MDHTRARTHALMHAHIHTHSHTYTHTQDLVEDFICTLSTAHMCPVPSQTFPFARLPSGRFIWVQRHSLSTES